MSLLKLITPISQRCSFLEFSDRNNLQHTIAIIPFILIDSKTTFNAQTNDDVKIEKKTSSENEEREEKSSHTQSDRKHNYFLLNCLNETKKNE